MRGSPPSVRACSGARARAFRSSASAAIVRNFQIRNVRRRAPIRSWRKKTGPRESSLIEQRDHERRAARGGAARRRRRRGRTPASGPATSAEPERRHAEQRQPLDVWTSRPGADHVEEPRHDLDLHVRRRSSVSHESEQLRRDVVARTRRSTRSTSSCRDESRQLLGRPEHGQIAEPRRRRSVGSRVDEADDVDAVLGVLEELAGDELPDLAGADDDGVLEVARRVACRSPARRTNERDEPIATAQKSSEPTDVRVRQVRRRVNTKTSQEPTVTSTKTPMRSSAVEWSTCSSSRS